LICWVRFGCITEVNDGQCDKIRFGRLTHWTGQWYGTCSSNNFFCFWLMTHDSVMGFGTHNPRTPSTEDSWSGLSSMLLQCCWTYKGDSTKTWSDPHFFRVSFLLWRFCYWMLLVVNC
jgi:hypothetical protein